MHPQRHRRANTRSLLLLLRRAPSTFRTRLVPIAPDGELPYQEADWRDAIVLVERGEVDLVCRGGHCRRFRSGDVLWLSPLPLRALRNRGRHPVVLLAVSRAGDEFSAGRRSCLFDSRPLSDQEVSAMASGFVWFDLRAKHPPAAADFYGKLLGWNVQPDGESAATVAGESGPWAAIVPQGPGEPAWVPYVQVEDVDSATERAVVLGAEVLQEATEGPAGRFSTIVDPGGAALALWQPRA